MKCPHNLEKAISRSSSSVLVSSGKCKEMIGKDLTHEQVNKLSEEETKKFHKRYEAGTCK